MGRVARDDLGYSASQQGRQKMTMLDVAIAVVVVAGLVALYWAVAGGEE